MNHEIEALTLGPIILASQEIDETVLNHELIHVEQYKDLFYIGFPFIYFYDLFYNLVILKMDLKQAYENSRAEKEAYKHEHNLNYLSIRKKRAWLNASKR